MCEKNDEKNNHTLVYESDRKTDGFDIFFWIFNDKSSFVATHWHTAIEIMYIIKGQVNVTYGNKDIILFPGDSLLIDSRVPHSTRSANGNNAILLQLPYEMLKKYIPEIDELNFFYDCHSGNPRMQESINKFIAIIKRMQDAFVSNTKGQNILFNSLVFEMLYLMYTEFSYKSENLSFNGNPQVFLRLEPVLNYIKHNYNKKLSLQEIADFACMQSEYFCHYFKKNVGVTYLQYLNEIRLSHICHDLTDTTDTLNVILERHGFTNYKLFREMFYKQFQMTPGEYRKRQES